MGLKGMDWTRLAYVPSSMWAAMFHTHTQQKANCSSYTYKQNALIKIKKLKLFFFSVMLTQVSDCMYHI